MNSNHIGPGNYQGTGGGNNANHFIEATIGGKGITSPIGSDRSQGEVPGAGSIYAAVLNERPNLSNPRNMGPTRAPSPSAMNPIPSVTTASRSTGRIRLHRFSGVR